MADLERRQQQVKTPLHLALIALPLELLLPPLQVGHHPLLNPHQLLLKSLPLLLQLLLNSSLGLREKTLRFFRVILGQPVNRILLSLSPDEVHLRLLGRFPCLKLLGSLQLDLQDLNVFLLLPLLIEELPLPVPHLLLLPLILLPPLLHSLFSPRPP